MFSVFHSSFCLLSLPTQEHSLPRSTAMECQPVPQRAPCPSEPVQQRAAPEHQPRARGLVLQGHTGCQQLSIPFPPCPGCQRRRNMQKQEQEALCRITDKLLLAILFLGFPSNDRNVNFFFSCFQTAFFNIFSLFICLSSPEKI